MLWGVIAWAVWNTSSGSENERVGLIVGIGIPFFVVACCVLWPEVSRWVSAVLLGLILLGFWLAAFKVWKFRGGGAWIAVAVIPAGLLALSTLPELWPIDLRDSVWFVAPLLAPPVIVSSFGWQVVRRRRVARIAYERAAQEKSEREAEAQRAEEQRVQALFLEQQRVAAEQMRQRNLEETRRRRIDEAQQRATRIAHQQDQDARLGPKRVFKRRVRVLKEIWWEEQRGSKGIGLVALAKACRLTVHQTYAAVNGLRQQHLVTTTPRPGSELWTDLTIACTLEGVTTLEGKIVTRKTTYKGNATSNKVKHTGSGQFNLGTMSGNTAGSITQTSGTDKDLQVVLDAARVLSSELAKSNQISQHDEIVARAVDLQTAEGPAAKRSALEEMGRVAKEIGPIAKPLLDLINGVMDMFQPGA